MSSIAFRDTMATMAELEDIQCIHFLRTEASRGEEVSESSCWAAILKL